MTSIGEYKGIPITPGTDAEIQAQMQKINLGPAQPPDNAKSVVPTPSVQLPQTNPTTPNTGGIGGMVEYYKSLFDTATTQAADAKAAKEAAVAQQTTQSQPFLSKLLGAKSPSEAKADATTATGVNPAEYFASEKAQLSEIDALNTEYNAAVAAKDEAIAKSKDTLGSNNFINNQIAQIERNAAPRLNQLSSNLKAKAAILEATQGRFNEAQTYIKQAVADATADVKFNFDMYNELYDQNQTSIDKLDTKYQSALKDATSAAKSAWETSVTEKNAIGELMIANPQAGITLTDTLEQAQAKVAGKPKATKPEIFGSAGTGYYEQVYDPKTNKFVTKKVIGAAPTTSGGDGKQINAFRGDASSYIEKLASDKISWGAAFNALKTKYPEASNELIDQTLNKQSYYTVKGTK